MNESEIRFDDCGEMEPLNTIYGGAEPNTKCRRLLKTGLINMSFVAMVSLYILLQKTLLLLKVSNKYAI